MGCAFLFNYQLLSVGDKISFHLLKSSSPLHTTSSARKELTTIVDVLVVMKASEFIMPIHGEAGLCCWKTPPATPLLGDCEVSVHKVSSAPSPCPALIVGANCYWNQKQKAWNKIYCWGRSTNWKTSFKEAFFIHKGQHSGSPCAISLH